MKFHAVPYASMQTFPPANGVGRGQAYQTAGTPTGMSSNFLISEVTVKLKWLFICQCEYVYFIRFIFWVWHIFRLFLGTGL